MKNLSLKTIKMIENLVKTLKRPFSTARSSYELRFGVDFGLNPYFKNLIWIFENLTWIFSIVVSQLQIDRSPSSGRVERTDLVSENIWNLILEI